MKLLSLAIWYSFSRSRSKAGFEALPTTAVALAQPKINCGTSETDETNFFFLSLSMSRVGAAPLSPVR